MDDHSLLGRLLARFRKARPQGSSREEEVPADHLAQVMSTAAPTRPVTDEDRALAAKIVQSMVASVRHEEDIDDLRGQEAMVARLVPQIPLRDPEELRSWLGGGAALPAGVPWPERGGRRAMLLAQICCADLPAELWEGLGPRDGWLTFFMHPVEYAIDVRHLPELGPLQEAPEPDEAIFAPSHGMRHGEHRHLPRRAFPRWPIDIVAVTPAGPDPRAGAASEPIYEEYTRGYDLASPEHRPFDWPSTLAMLELAEQSMLERRASWASTASMLAEQLKGYAQKLADLEAAPEPGDDLPGLRNRAHDLPRAIEAFTRAEAMCCAAAIAVEQIAARTRERAKEAPFSDDEIAPIMAELRAIEWMHVQRKNAADRGPGAEDPDERVLPLTVHDPAAAQWVHKFEAIRFDWAKHAYTQSPRSLPPSVREYFERLWRDLARRDMASMGHVPFRYVHEYDPEEEVTLLELPSSTLMSWMFGDVDNLVLTMKRVDLAAGDFSNVLVQFSN